MKKTLSILAAVALLAVLAGCDTSRPTPVTIQINNAGGDNSGGNGTGDTTNTTDCPAGYDDADGDGVCEAV